jgi:hypothetical protein
MNVIETTAITSFNRGDAGCGKFRPTPRFGDRLNNFSGSCANLRNDSLIDFVPSRLGSPGFLEDMLVGRRGRLR